MVKFYCPHVSLIMFVLAGLILTPGITAQSISDTYTDGHIPTSHPNFDSSCNGPGTTLVLELPPGASWEVTGIDISYSMTSQGIPHVPDQQRSRIHFQNTGEEENVQNGVGNTLNTTYNYNRLGVDIANGIYPGGEELVFEMRAWRTLSLTGGGCNTQAQRVDNNTWTITVHYQAAPSACDPPEDVEVSDITYNQATVSWTETGDATEWDIEYGESGFEQGEGTLIPGVTENSYQLTGLDPDFGYDVYVRSDCDGEESDWVGPVSFTTDEEVCEAPTDFSVDVIDQTFIEISWTEPVNTDNIEGYGWVVVLEGELPFEDDHVSEGMADVGETSAVVTGLEPDTTYDIYLLSVCDLDEMFFSDFISETFTTENLGVNDSFFSGFSLYPNPAEDNIVLKSAGMAIEAVSIVDINGRELVFQRPGKQDVSVDISHFSAGVYFLRVNILDSTKIFKLIKR